TTATYLAAYLRPKLFFKLVPEAISCTRSRFVKHPANCEQDPTIILLLCVAIKAIASDSGVSGTTISGEQSITDSKLSSPRN
ncbi:hypothetical protein, partial [Nostoc sp. CCY 9925]|uniref:hypothetical protein n=1 Tax=Nostoc sp. CCY 9925 TaxID=3103865 RepID=UPI0039C631ED